jgi:hypothetical protein
MDTEYVRCEDELNDQLDGRQATRIPLRVPTTGRK